MMPLRILAIAFEFKPHLTVGSYDMRPVNNWRLVEQLARFGEVTVMTNSLAQESVLDELSRGALPKVKMQFIELPLWLRRWYSQDPDHPLIVYFWEKRALKTALQLHSEIAFDAVHHFSPELAMPPLIGADFPAAFFWGPIRGSTRSRFKRAPVQTLLPRLLKAALTFLMKKTGIFNRLLRRDLVKTRMIFLDKPTSLIHLPDEVKEKVRFVPCGGISRKDVPQTTSRRETAHPFSILAAGGFDHMDGLILTIHAFQEFRQNHPAATLTIVSPKQAAVSLQNLYPQLGLGNSIHWKGWLPPEVLMQEFVKSDLLVVPDFDSASASLAVHALSARVPVITAQGGSADPFVEDAWGIKIPWNNSQLIIRELILAMDYILSDPARKRRMERAGIKFVKNSLLWEKIGNLLELSYVEELLQGENIHIQVTGKGRTFY